MMRTKFVFLVVCAMLLSIIPGTALADTFELGAEESELQPDPNDWIWTDYENGWLYTEDIYKDEAPLIFDNNSGTGIDNEYGPGHTWMDIVVMFHMPLNVSNISIRPSFGQGASTCIFYIIINNYEFNVADMINTNVTIDINATIDGIKISLDSFGSNHFSFNDVLINYTSPPPTNLADILDEINALKQRMNALEDRMDDLESMMALLNTTITNLNLTNQSVTQNITNLLNSITQLNESLTNLTNEFNNLNVSAPENITVIEQNITNITNQISEITQIIEQFPENVTGLSDINERMNSTAQEIEDLNEDINELKDSLPESYDDTALRNRIAALESENTQLKSDLDELEDESKKTQTSVEEKPSNILVWIAILIAFLAIIFALVAGAIALKKRRPEEPSPEAYDEDSDEAYYEDREDVYDEEAEPDVEEEEDDVVTRLDVIMGDTEDEGMEDELEPETERVDLRDRQDEAPAEESEPEVREKEKSVDDELDALEKDLKDL